MEGSTSTSLILPLILRLNFDIEFLFYLNLNLLNIINIYSLCELSQNGNLFDLPHPQSVNLSPCGISLPSRSVKNTFPLITI